MQQLVFDKVGKSYGPVRAVQDVSFAVGPGEIFGLLGPNGAGKTTLIRILMDIVRADTGRISIDGRATHQLDKDRIGYLPEERGLYRKQRVLDILVYFGMLKGMTRAGARTAAQESLERAGLADRASNKVETLSKGMQQKVQILSTILHDPEIVVMDEPFTGLDPVNVRLVREILEELKRAGKIIILSTHQMALVEALCDRIAMIDKGRLVLYGSVRDIRRAHARNVVSVTGAGPWDTMSTVAEARRDGERWALRLADGAGAREFLAEALARGAAPESFEAAQAPLEEIFVDVVQGGMRA